jgi:hypothetical protein
MGILFVVENMTFGRHSVNINGVTTVDWLPCFYKLTFEVEKDNFHHSFKVNLPLASLTDLYTS